MMQSLLVEPHHPVTQAKMVGAFDANNDLTALRMRTLVCQFLNRLARAALAQ
jgi:hypothetical protein